MRLVQRVEVNPGRSSLQEGTALIGGPFDSQFDDRLIVFPYRFEPLVQCIGDAGATYLGEPLYLGRVGDRHDARYDGETDADTARSIYESEVVGGIEKQLR